MEQKKIDGLMEVWRQWAARRGIGEAAGEGNGITRDGRWTPTRSWLTNGQGQKERQTGLHSQVLHITEPDHLLLLFQSANDI